MGIDAGDAVLLMRRIPEKGREAAEARVMDPRFGRQREEKPDEEERAERWGR